MRGGARKGGGEVGGSGDGVLGRGGGREEVIGFDIRALGGGREELERRHYLRLRRPLPFPSLPSSQIKQSLS